MFGPVYFLSGDGYPTNNHVDRELQRRLSPSFARWTGQKDIHDPTPMTFQLNDFPSRSAHLESYLTSQGADRNIVLMGRSSGARLATWHASRHPVAAVICLGYPFRNPSTGPEPERYRHLADLTVPTLILQGVRDEYGGSNVFSDYALSPSVRVARLVLKFCQDVLR